MGGDWQFSLARWDSSERGGKEQWGQVGCPAADLPGLFQGQTLAGLRRPMAKASSLISLQNEATHTNLEFVWLDLLENHTSALNRLKNKKTTKKPKQTNKNPARASEFSKGRHLARCYESFNEGKRAVSFRIWFEWLLIEIKVTQCYYKPSFMKTI